jgi:NADH-quinone oxidoreductase subunit L
MNDIRLNLWIIPLLPLIGAAINGLFGRRFNHGMVKTVALLFTAASFAYAVWAALQGAHMKLPYNEALPFDWIAVPSANFHVPWGFYLDQLSTVMMLIVTGVGFLIHIYSTGYMEHEGGYYRFFAYLNLFMFFMLTLVLANNYLLMFVGWEGVGLASYLLIGFFFLKDSAANAGKKAFIVNRIGDFAFLLGMFLLIKEFNSLNFSTIFTALTESNRFQVETRFGLLSLIALLLMFGATGKSAQIPLYVWLPDAMEGPTPVSALIHAATMVTAGIYMIARSSAIFSRAPIMLEVVAVIGALTAIFAATMGMTQTDIKRVLAYSTVSQLGYMFMACGVAAYSAGIFHLMTHAFFKALLFLGAGSVIHAVGGEQDMRRMGGLRKLTPVTFWVMLIATIAIAGIPPFAGFFSKDEILWQASRSAHGGMILWAIGIITAGLTSFYMFRLIFMTFFGELRLGTVDAGEEPHKANAPAHAGHASASHSHGHADDHGHGHGGVHESPWIMLAPLVVLAALSIVGGWVGVPKALGGSAKFENYLKPAIHSPADVAAEEQGSAATEEAAEEPGERSTELTFTVISVGVALAGLGLAWLLYIRRPELPRRITSRIHGLYLMVLHKYYIDEGYQLVLIKPLMALSTHVFWRGVDQGLIDGAVNGAGTASKEIGNELRRMQSGNIRSYAAWVAAGGAAVIAYMIYLGVK